MIRLAKEKELDNIQEIYVYARKFMAEHGNPTQWGQTRPTEETLRKDIEKEQLYVIEERDRLQGVFALIIGEDPTYQNIEQGSWKDTNDSSDRFCIGSPWYHGAGTCICVEKNPAFTY